MNEGSMFKWMFGTVDLENVDRCLCHNTSLEILYGVFYISSV